MAKKEEFILGDNTFKLPIGYTDKDGKVHREVKLRPVTGRVEEAMDEPEIKENGAKVLTELIKGIIVKLGDINFMKEGESLKRKIVDSLTIIDRDAILLYNSFVSDDYDTKMLEFTHECPNKKKESELKLDLTKTDILFSEEAGKTEYQFELIDGVYDKQGNVNKNITVQLPTGEMQEAVYPYFQKELQAKGITEMVQRMTIDLGKANLDKETFRDMTKRDRKLIYKELPSKLQLGVDYEVKYKCTHCKETHTTQVPLGKLLQGDSQELKL